MRACQAATVFGLTGRAPVLFLCEHASNAFPPELGPFAISDDIAGSHVAWDPGARALAVTLGRAFGAPVVAGAVSRLLYDCNRPPEAHDAIPTRSDIYDIKPNQNLSEEARAARVAMIYRPFCAAVDAAIEEAEPQAIITVHSFTPVFMGKVRDETIGVIHDTDARLADALLARADAAGAGFQRNRPYGPQDGVTHSLQRATINHGLANVMLEVRNDLLTQETGARDIAALLVPLLGAALADCAIKVESAAQ